LLTLTYERKHVSDKVFFGSPNDLSKLTVILPVVRRYNPTTKWLKETFARNVRFRDARLFTDALRGANYEMPVRR
jgi:hypothetical protein